IESTRTEVWYIRIVSSPIVAQTLERFSRAQFLDDAGREREALRWLQTISLISGGESLYRAESARRMGLIFERLGDTTAARLQYRRFLGAWSQADAVFQPVMEDTRARLAVLGG
ncbi:MAG: hypothetical protein V3S19_01020, partial [Gemmatimonadales bacterium]